MTFTARIEYQEKRFFFFRKFKVLDNLTDQWFDNSLYSYRQIDGVRGVIPISRIKEVICSKELDVIVQENIKKKPKVTE